MSLWNLQNAMVNRKVRTMKLSQLTLGLLPGLLYCGVDVAQDPIQPVQWSSAVFPKGPVKTGGKFAIELSAEVQDGWHVYGLTQISGGPIPLRVSVDENGTAQTVREASGTAPVRKHDSSFNLETEVYSHSFSIHLPAQIKQHAAAGDQFVPVSVRFQACNDRTCLPPRIVHLTVLVEVLPGT
jgi:DsbC/DsbD-like thiol-disulfide interchange protein